MSLKCRLRGKSHGADGIKASDRIRELEDEVVKWKEESHTLYEMYKKYVRLEADALREIKILNERLDLLGGND